MRQNDRKKEKASPKVILFIYRVFSNNGPKAFSSCSHNMSLSEILTLTWGSPDVVHLIKYASKVFGSPFKATTRQVGFLV